MTQLTRLNNLFHEYTTTADVTSAARSKEAFANEVFGITTSDGQRYFLKILSQSQEPAAIANEVSMQEQLLASGIITPRYLGMPSGSYIGECDDERFVLSEHISGAPPRIVSHKLIGSLGATLARLHDSLNGITVPKSTLQLLDPQEIQGAIMACDRQERQTLNTFYNFGSQILDLPHAVIHGDLQLGNVFAEGDDVTAVFDLETAAHLPRVADIARTFTSIRFNSDPAKFPMDEVIGELTSGYNSAADMPLTPEEIARSKAAIVYVCGAYAAWHTLRDTRYKEPWIQYGNEAIGSIEG